MVIFTLATVEEAKDIAYLRKKYGLLLIREFTVMR